MTICFVIEPQKIILNSQNHSQNLVEVEMTHKSKSLHDECQTIIVIIAV